MNLTITAPESDALPYLKSRFSNRYVRRNDDGAVAVDDHFPGGRLDAAIKADGSWTILRTDFGTRESGGMVESLYAVGNDKETLAEKFAAAMDVLTNGVPVVGGPATFTIATDVYACTVVALNKSSTKATLRRDKATLLNGVGSGEPDAMQFSPGGFVGHFSGRQRYAYEPDPSGEEFVVTRRVCKGGRIVWKLVGSPTQSAGFNARFLGRHEHEDFNY